MTRIANEQFHQICRENYWGWEINYCEVDNTFQIKLSGMDWAWEKAENAPYVRKCSSLDDALDEILKQAMNDPAS